MVTLPGQVADEEEWKSVARRKMLQFEQQLHEGEKMNLSSSYMKVNVRTFSLGRMNLNSICMKVNYTFTRTLLF